MFALRRAKLEISSIPLSEVDLSFQCHCLPTQQPPFHFETHYHKCEDFYWLVSFFITGSKSYRFKLAILISKVIWKYTLALILYHLEILLLFGCIHNDRLSKSRSGISFISYKDLHLRYWIKNVQREYENIISYLPLLASSPKTLISCIINGKLQSVVASSRRTRWLLHFVLVKYYSIFVKFQVSIFYFTYHLK